MDSLEIVKEIGKEAPWGVVAILWSLIAYRAAPVVIERWKGSAVKRLNGSLSEQIRYAVGPFVQRIENLERWKRDHSGATETRERELATVIADVRNLKERHSDLNDSVNALRNDLSENHVALTEAIGRVSKDTSDAIAASYRIIAAEIRTAMKERP